MTPAGKVACLTSPVFSGVSSEQAPISKTPKYTHTNLIFTINEFF
jgi:hypothetical protein